MSALVYTLMTPFAMAVMNYISTFVICERYHIINERNIYGEVCAPKQFFLNVFTTIMVAVISFGIMFKADIGPVAHSFNYEYTGYNFSLFLKLVLSVPLFWIALMSIFVGIRNGVPKLSRFVNKSLDNIKLKLPNVFKKHIGMLDNNKTPKNCENQICAKPIVIDLDPNRYHVSKLD